MCSAIESGVLFSKRSEASGGPVPESKRSSCALRPSLPDACLGSHLLILQPRPLPQLTPFPVSTLTISSLFSLVLQPFLLC